MSHNKNWKFMFDKYQAAKTKAIILIGGQLNV